MDRPEKIEPGFKRSVKPGEKLTQKEREAIFDEVRRKAQIEAILPALGAGLVTSVAIAVGLYLRYDSDVREFWALVVIAPVVILFTLFGMYQYRTDKGLVKAGLEDPDILENREDDNPFRGR